MIEKDKIQFNFSYYALNLLGKQMYTNRWSAISELIANGLDAGATKVNLYIESIDKKNSILEIIDNGSGMDYDDLSTKYALIGRNKRLSSEDLSEKTKGRKGIGKLATLFLSKKYYIVSKKDGIASAWMLDSTDALDSDIPELVRVPIDDVHIENTKIWDEIESGTLIKSVGVNLAGFAEGKLESLKMTLANYYLLDNLGADIEVAYRTDVNQAIEFSKVSKVIGFKNFYAFFQTDKTVVNMDLLNDSVKISADLEEVSNKLRQVKRIYPSEISRISLTGKEEFLNIDGELEEITYELTGWIGIHSTINMSEALENTGTDTKDRFIRNQVYKANQLRLYVRDKLAVSDFMPLLNNTQAFGAYIEGEISFDVLDHDRLEDISTTNREGLSGNDERITLLIDLLKPIVNKLISERANIGSVVRKEVDEIRRKEKKALEEKRIQEEEAKKIAEEERREAELARKTAEREKIEAQQKQRQAEVAKEVEREKRLVTEQELKITSKQALFLRKLTNPKFENATEALHAMYTESDSIELSINSISQILNEYQATDIIAEVDEDIYGITISAQKIKKIYDLAFSADFRLSDQTQSFILQEFIEQYIKDLLKPTKDRYSKIKFKYQPEKILTNKIKFNTAELGLVVDNLVNNSFKAGASNIDLDFYTNGIYTVMEFKDDGEGLSSAIITPDRIFELGYTTTESTGVGLSHVKRVMEENGGYIKLHEKNERGFCLELGFLNEY
ncbi:TPA: ATP-binding protein [Streptococcus suis]|uniref:histidine kinase n=3 Tax=Streptococcus suis TaxID=1307 RepID=A0A0Z8I7Y7_STRSU|nr:ATP-binding protein [Streptococcus suis]MBY4990868.1 ATP-binding protein [Streptococcus suis]MDW8732286.1 ATP-binding protein [Streptococcus suis]NQG58751.1 ATP-binding protein [Streptococcus suis]NQH17367.1 ATP-binding protein [Streptococcus suis]NQK49936.1 ATP-binding protein [Streptococcus suis]